jgi:hypothetical protein
MSLLLFFILLLLLLLLPPLLCSALHCSELLLWDLSLLLCCFCTLPITSPELGERGGEGRREIMKEEDE